MLLERRLAYQSCACLPTLLGQSGACRGPFTAALPPALGCVTCTRSCLAREMKAVKASFLTPGGFTPSHPAFIQHMLIVPCAGGSGSQILSKAWLWEWLVEAMPQLEQQGLVRAPHLCCCCWVSASRRLWTVGVEVGVRLGSCTERSGLRVSSASQQPRSCRPGCGPGEADPVSWGPGQLLPASPRKDWRAPSETPAPALTQPEHCSDHRPLGPTWPGQLAAECSSWWGGRPDPGAFGPLPGALAQKSFPTDAAQPRGAGLVLWFHPRGAGGQVRAPHPPRATPGRRLTGRGLLGLCM